MHSKMIALIDADILAFQAIMLSRAPWCSYEDCYTMQDAVDTNAAREEFETRVIDAVALSSCRSAWLCWSDTTRKNWRKNVMPEYKAHRRAEKPLGYAELVKWARSKFDSIAYRSLEADDVIGILHTRFTNTVAISEDKDFLQLPGKLFNPRAPEQGVIDISEAEANEYHLYQCLVGDSADGYKGCPGIGKKRATNIIYKHATLAECWNGVVNAYIRSGLSKKDALLNARVARILRSKEYDIKACKVRLWKPPIG